MGHLPSLKARELLRILFRCGYVIKVKRGGSHRLLIHSDGRTLLFAFHDGEEIGPRMLAKVLKDARISPEAFQKHR